MNKRSVPLVLLTLILGSCSDAPTVPEPIGTIVVSVRASGGDLDNDFQVVLGDGSRRDVVANSTVSLNTDAPAQRVELQGVAANCAVAGQNPVSVDVPAGSSVAITFGVICATTGIHIRTRTNGFAEPAGYEVLVENRGSVKIAANDSLLMSRLEPGTYSVALALPGSHCRVAGMPQLQVAVANRTVTPVLFEITCVPPAHPEKIAYMWLPPKGRYMISLMNPDGSGAFDLAAGSSPDWSPDGAKLAYSTLTCDSYDDPCSGGIVVADPESRHFTALSNGKSGYSPTWAPTGDMLAFVEVSLFGSGSSTYTLKIIRLDGSPSVAVPLPSHHGIGELDWSPDGRRIAFTCVVSSGNPDICVVNTDGSGFVWLSGPDSETNPAWSPDGSQIAFTTWPGGTSMVPPSIAVMAPDGSGFRRITTGGSPAWSPDGTRLVFAAENGLFTVRLDGSDLKRLTSGKHTAPAWRP